MVYGQLPPEEIATGLGFDLGLVLELGAIFLATIVLQPCKYVYKLSLNKATLVKGWGKKLIKCNKLSKVYCNVTHYQKRC